MQQIQRLELLGLVVSTRNTRTEVAPARPQDAELLYVPLSVLHEAAERGDAVATRQADEEFHAVLLERTGNPFLVQVIDWLSVHFRRLNTLYFTQDRSTTNSYQDHLEIIAADNILRTIDVVQQPVT